MVKLFNECPLGTRFKYAGGKQVFVVISHYGLDGGGTVAKWEGVNANATIQGVYSAEENENSRNSLYVHVE